MTSIEVFLVPEQELVLDAIDYCAHVDLGDIAIYIPGDSPEKRAAWLMGFWEQLTEYMAEYADKEHLTDWVEGGNKWSISRLLRTVQGGNVCKFSLQGVGRLPTVLVVILMKR